MGDGLPSSTPEKSGDNKATTNAASNENDGKPEEKLNPTQTQKGKKSRLTKLEWGGFFVDLYVTLWIWSDLVGCLEIKKLSFLIATIFVAHGVLCYFLSKIFKSWRWALTVWIVLCSTAAEVVWENSRAAAESKQHPHFILSLNSINSRRVNLYFTNACLFKTTNFLGIGLKDGLLVIPIEPGHTNPTLCFFFINDSIVKASDAEILLTVHKAFKFIGPGWKPNGLVDDDPIMQGFIAQNPSAILPEDGIGLPELTLTMITNDAITEITTRDQPQNLTLRPIAITIRSSETPRTFMAFWVCFTTLTNVYNEPRICEMPSEEVIGTNKAKMAVPAGDNKASSVKFLK
jgi:hypothetical protein